MKIFKPNLTSVSVFLLFMLSLTMKAQDITINLTPTKDAFVNSSNPAGNYGEEVLLNIQSWEEDEFFTQRSLLFFDINSGVPYNAYIVSATLKLHGNDHIYYSPAMNIANLRQITEPWEELGVNWENQPMAVQTNQKILQPTASSQENLVVDILDWVRDYISGNGYPNFGFLIQLEQESPFSRLSYHSKESPLIGPELEIVYRLPTELVFEIEPNFIQNCMPDENSLHVNVIQGDGPFQFLWSSNAGSSTNSQVSGLSAGTYTLTITDNNQLSVSKEIGIGYDPKWIIPENSYFNYYSGLLKKVKNIISWSQVIESEQTLTEPYGWVEYAVKPYTGRKMFGFGKAGVVTQNDWTDLEYGVYFHSDMTLRMVIDGFQTILGGYIVGDLIRIERDGSNFKIYQNGNLINSSARTISELSGEISAKVAASHPGTQFENIRTSFGSLLELYFDIEHNALPAQSEGYIKVNVSCGTPPYTYEWEDIQGNPNLIGNENHWPATVDGTYYVTVTDATGNTSTGQGTVKTINENWNWEEEKFYDNNGVLISANKTYFDDLENPIQNQQRLIEQDNTLISQTVYDTYGRPAITTLSAPVFKKEFEFKDDFIKAVDDDAYDYNKFDNLNTSSQILGEVYNPFGVQNTSKGSLGWYFSDNNIQEPYVSTTQFPYSRVEYSKLNPDVIRRTASPHDHLKMGSGHENQVYKIPVAGEIIHFFGFRGWNVSNHMKMYDFFAAQGSDDFIHPVEEPELPFISKAWKTISIDADGKESITFTDIDGKVIASCLSGSSEGGTNINVFKVESKISSTSPGSYVDIHIPEGIDNSDVKLIKSGPKNYDIYNLKTDEVVLEAVSNSEISLPPGIYRITDNIGGNITAVNYKLNYHHISLNYYNHTGNLVSSVSPDGFDNNFDFSTVNITRNNQSRGFEYNTSYPNKWKFNGAASGFPHEFKHSMTSNPDESSHFQYSNILVFLRKIGDPDPVVGFDINSGNVTHNPGDIGYPEGGGSQGEGGEPIPSTESMYVASSGNGIESIDESTDDDPNGATLIGPGGGGIRDRLEDDFGLRSYDIMVCQGGAPGVSLVRPKDIEYALTIALYAKYLDEFGMPIEKKIGFDKTITVHQWGGMINGINRGDLVLRFTANETISEQSLIDLDLANGNIHGVLGYSIPNSISNSITELRLEVVELSAKELNYSLVQSIGSCNTYNISTVSYDDYQVIEDNLELRLKEFTYLMDDAIVPDHRIEEVYNYNNLGEQTGKYSKDEGLTEYLYTQEGWLRFSQNEVQRNATPIRFSYTNYDSQGRVIETGEAKEDNIAGLRFQNFDGDITMNSGDLAISDPNILNNVLELQLTDAEKIEPSYFVYDNELPSNSSNLAISTIINAMPFGYEQKRVWGQLSYSWNGQNATVYSYDTYGRLEWTVNSINGLGVKTNNIFYTDRGDIKKVIFQKNIPNEYFEHHYVYGISGNLKGVYTREADNAYYKNEANYRYYIHGPLKRIEIASNLQGIDFIYNTLGYLKAINSPELGNTGSQKFVDPGSDGQNGFEADIFGMTLDYFSGDYQRAGINVNYGDGIDDSYNGNHYQPTNLKIMQ